MASVNRIQELADNPESFLKVNRLDYSISRDFTGEGRVKLVKEFVQGQGELFKLSKVSDSEKTIRAYLLGYKSLESQKNDASYVDVPSTGVEEAKFLFTANLSGCSVVVTLLNHHTYRVFHDSRPDSAVLYDDVVMCADLGDYKLAGLFSPGYAVACMQFKQGAWKLFVQQQYPKTPTGTVREVLRLEVIDRVKVPLQTAFEQRRGWMQQRIKDLAKALSIDSATIAAAKDGTYQGKDKFDENDPSISGWKKLRDAIEKKLGEHFAEIDKKRLEKDFGNYLAMAHASENLDKTWLWLQVKKVTDSKGK